MKKNIMLFIFCWPILILEPRCDDVDINEGHLYHEERENLEKISSKQLFNLLGEDESHVYTNCFGTDDPEEKTLLESQE